MYLIESGRFRIAEHGLDVKAGDIVGELGMLSRATGAPARSPASRPARPSA